MLNGSVSLLLKQIEMGEGMGMKFGIVELRYIIRCLFTSRIQNTSDDYNKSNKKANLGCSR